MQFDSIDVKLVYLLGRNSRLSYTRLAKTLRQSREVIAFRVKKLIKEGVIQNSIVNINPNILGLIHVQIFLRLHGASLEHISVIDSFIKSNSNIIFSQRLVGNWDYVITTIHYKTTDLSDFLDKLTSDFHEISKIDFLFISYEKGPGWAMIISEKESLPEIPVDNTAFTSFFKNQKQINAMISVDETNKKILTELAKNSRLGIVEMAKKISVSYRSVHKRIAGLISDGVIAEFALVGSIFKFGFSQWILLINLKNIKKNELKACELFESFRYCSRYWRTFGLAHFRLSIYCRSQQELGIILEKIRYAFGSDLISIHVLQSIAQIKRTGFTEYLKK